MGMDLFRLLLRAGYSGLRNMHEPCIPQFFKQRGLKLFISQYGDFPHPCNSHKPPHGRNGPCGFPPSHRIHDPVHNQLDCRVKVLG